MHCTASVHAVWVCHVTSGKVGIRNGFRIGRGYPLYTRIPWTERQNLRCVHRFRGPNANSRCVNGFRGPYARTLVALTDSVDWTPELSLRSRIPWTKHQIRSIVVFTDSVNRMPGVVIASTDSVNSTPHESCELLGSDSDAMKSRCGTCLVL
jgi:hypothetical protein